MNPRESKSHLRTTIARTLKACHVADRRTASTEVCDALTSLSLNGLIMGYLPLPDELDVTPYLQTRLELGLAVPVVDWTAGTMHAGRLSGLSGPHVVAGRHGVCSPAVDDPVPAAQLDAVLVPGVAFDRTCRRLGRGGGFYDRFLNLLPSHCLTIGIGFDEQLVESVPTEAWDRQLHLVVTPQGVFNKP